MKAAEPSPCKPMHRDRAEVNRAVASVREALGPITILINNAAIESFCPFPEISGENWDHLIAVNLTGVYFVAQAVLPDMLAAGWGRIAIDGNLFPVSHEQILASYPIPRIGQPEEVAVACAFFASGDAGYITGQTLGVNGGCCT